MEKMLKYASQKELLSQFKEEKYFTCKFPAFKVSAINNFQLQFFTLAAISCLVVIGFIILY